MVRACSSRDVVDGKASSTASVFVGCETFELVEVQAAVSIMNIAVIMQPDSAVIPENISKLTAVPGVILKSIIILDVKSALANKRSYFLRGFGAWQCCRLFVRLIELRVEHTPCLQGKAAFSPMELPTKIPDGLTLLGV
jgi:hypothetical protein